MNILAIGPHPDDLEINAYGTLAKCVRRGDRVTCASVSNGNLGHYVYMPEELRRIRLEEARAAAGVIGAEYLCLDCGDLAIDATDADLQRKMVELMRRAQPDLIITNPPNDYMSDHVETNKLVFYAAFASSIPHYGAGNDRVCETVPIYYYESSGGMGFVPDEYVDVSDTYALKLEALQCHRSQLEWLDAHDSADTIKEMEITAMFRGMQSRVRYAEGFMNSRLHLRMRTYRLLP